MLCLSRQDQPPDKRTTSTFVLRMESQVLQTSGLTPWASLKPRCPSHARRPAPALPRLAAQQLCSALRSSSLVRFQAAAFDLHHPAVFTPSTREAACWAVFGRVSSLMSELQADCFSFCPAERIKLWPSPVAAARPVTVFPCRETLCTALAGCNRG